MAYLDTYIATDMLTGFNFSGLGWGNAWFVSSGIEVDHVDGTYDLLNGNLNFAYDAYGNLVGTGTVTGYEAGAYDASYNYPALVVHGIAIPHNWVLQAAGTSSTLDDMAIVRAAFTGNDTMLGSDYADVLDGFAGSDRISGYNGADTIYGEAGDDTLLGMNGNDTGRGHRLRSAARGRW